jgi:lipid-A-disaccharide synthase
MEPVDILILSNGPGEMTTWVRPVVKALRQLLGEDRETVRISVVLSPCPHAMGKEADLARTYGEVDRVQSSEDFWNFLLWGKTAENWDWRSRGVVLFLGGDQFYAMALGKRLGYHTVIYAEWEARWYRWIDAFGVRSESVKQKIPSRYRSKAIVTGDLMADVQFSSPPSTVAKPIIGIMPGSKASKLTQGVPFCLAIAEAIHRQRPEVLFEIAVAPTLDLQTLAKYADPHQNAMVEKMGKVTAQLCLNASAENSTPTLETSGNLSIGLITEFPAHHRLNQWHFALTTVGANTAELGALTVPMIVLLPTQQLEAMQSWDGLPGMLARLPLLGKLLARLINYLIISQNRLYAWPNIWAGKAIIPELIGQLDPGQVAQLAISWLDQPEILARIKTDLSQVRGQPGAATAIAQLVVQQLTSP